MNWRKTNALCSKLNLNKLVLVIFLVLVINPSASSQDKITPISLRVLLNATEDRFDVSFTYADITIEDVFLVSPSDSLSLIETLDYFKQNTSLEFQQLDDRFITISNQPSEVIVICGYLLDADKQTGIMGATIQVGTKHTISSTEGYFEINKVTFDDSVLIRVLGYENLALPTKELRRDSLCKTLYLSPEITQLKEVMVMNYITTGINKQVNGSFNIAIDELGILPGLIEPDVLQTIQVLPGIQSINETVSHINVRGGTNDQNLVLWDGIKMYQTGHFFGLISAFNPYQTQEVRLQKNGTSAFLSEAVSSTLDIKSSNKVASDFSGQAGINLINADALITIPISKKVSLQLSGRRSITDVVASPVFDKYFERIFGNTDVTNSSNSSSDTTFTSDENFYFYDVGVNFLYDINRKNKLQVNFLNLYNQLDYQENLTSIIGSDSKNSNLTQQSIVAGLNYRRLWNNSFSTSAQFYGSSYDLKATNQDLINNQQVMQENEVFDTGVKLDANWTINNKWGLLSGYQFQENGIANLEEVNNPEFRRYIKEVIRTHSIFSEISYSSLSNLTNARFGLRANHFSKFNRTIIEPRLTVNQKLFSHFSIELQGELKSQTITQIIDLQNDFLGVEKRRWILANEDEVPILESAQISSGIHFTKDNLLISLEGFYKQVSGITSSSQGFQNQFQYIRATGSYNVKGLEFLANKQFANFSTWVGYSLTKNSYSFTSFIPSEFPNNLDITHTTTLASNAIIGHFELSAGVNAHTGRPYTIPKETIGNEIIYQEPNVERLPNYIRVDFSAKYKFNLSKGVKAQVGGSVWNLTNNQNIINIYYQLGENGEIQEVKKTALGITPNLMFRVIF